MILPDVGVWLAAVWGGHVRHPVAAAWFEHQSHRLALCRVTQMSLVRLVSNPAVMGADVVERSGAWHVIDELRADGRVTWADEPPYLEPIWRALSAREDGSHKLWTDDYLASFAQAADLALATLDGACAERYPSVRIETLR